MADIYSPLPYNFFSKKPLEVKFSGLDLSSDAGLLLVRQAEQGQQICQGLASVSGRPARSFENQTYDESVSQPKNLSNSRGI